MARTVTPTRIVVWLLLASLPQFAQQSDLVFRSETGLALIRFYVANKGKPVTGLRTQDLQLLEDGVPQKIALLEAPGARHLPVEVIILFDVSASVMMSSLLDPLSLKETILDRLGDQVGISIYGFAARREQFAQNTRDMNVLRDALKEARLFWHYGTPLYEAIRDTARDATASGTAATRVMVIFSDGFDTTKTPPKVAVDAAYDAGIPLYPVILGHKQLLDRVKRGVPPAFVWARQIQRENQLREQVVQQEKFAEFGPETGGQSYFPAAANSRMIRKILTELVDQLQSEYVVGYYPTSTGAAKKRKVEVKLLAKDKGQLHGGARMVVH